MIDFVPEPHEIGERVDLIVARRTGLARSVVQAALRSGEVTVAGAHARPSHRLRATDAVRGRVEPPVVSEPVAEDIPLAVRYDDERVLVVSKPAGLVTHPAHGHRGATLVNALLALGGPLARAGTTRPGIVHRLDKNTSGLLLVARDDEALTYLQEELRARRVRRGYLALVRGVTPAGSGTVDAPLARHPTRPTLRAVVPGGKPAVTHYERRDATEDASLLEVRLETGRTHQIRVHLGYIGHPVLGDRAYGGASELSARLGLTRPFLHAHELTWPHPSTGRLVSVADGLPDDLAEALGRAGLPGFGVR